ncbi:hypothetical protein SAMN04490244_11287 [Tranquillimonas rosea]|uniref:Autotransporter domain-containing protein n=1 Tax=Tranquillimonas rosea TaxID=641238 RepID=A0A1H9WQQ9_9RHOB|nr:hypothetical protein [Tranquillimonas rosea]SES36276.1 hypothetical protein SAMN04490244_11287 [Tranquillimonas rosea]
MTALATVAYAPLLAAALAGVGVPEGTAQDLVHNVAASDPTAPVTIGVLPEAALSRGEALLAAQPALPPFLGSGGGRFEAEAVSGSGRFQFSSRHEWPIWVRAEGEWSSGETSGSRSFHTEIGGHFYRQKNLRIGGMIQSDRRAGTRDSVRLKREDWMAGPYVVMKHGGQPLVFSGSLLLGTGRISAGASGTAQSYSAFRSILTLGVTGSVQLPGMTLLPHLKFGHLSGYSPVYSAPAQASEAISVIKSEVGLDFSRPIGAADRGLELVGGLTGHLSRAERDRELEDLSYGRVDLGLRHSDSAGSETRISTFVDGLGGDRQSNVGIGLYLDQKF